MYYSDDLETDMMDMEDWDAIEDEAMDEMRRRIDEDRLHDSSYDEDEF